VSVFVCVCMGGCAWDCVTVWVVYMCVYLHVCVCGVSACVCVCVCVCVCCVCACVCVGASVDVCIMCAWCNWVRGVYVSVGVREFGCVCWLGVCVRACG